MSGYPGVFKTRDKWYAKYKGTYIGVFKTVEEASKAIKIFKRTGKTHKVYKHGGSATPLYYCWASMKHRCSNKNAKWFHRYGGRGIKVCDNWKTFKPFKEWAEENGYCPSLVLDRIDNNGDYTPDNCRWATKSESMYNRDLGPSPGIRKVKNGWVAKASHKHLGYFNTKAEAQTARDTYFKKGEIKPRIIRRKRTDNKSGYSGIFQRKTGKWTAKFKNEYLGQFDTFEEAVEIRKRAEHNEIHGK